MILVRLFMAVVDGGIHMRDDAGMSDESRFVDGGSDAAVSGSGPIWSFFTDRESFRTIDSFRLLYAVTAVAAFFLTEVGRSVYRPYIYENGINDFGIADSMGNLGGIVVQIFFSLAILNSQRKKTFNVIEFLVVGYILYEFAQPYLPKGVFDWKDIYGTIIGGFASVIFVLVLRLIVKNHRVFIQF